MSKNISRRKFIKISSAGLVALGTAATIGKVATSPATMSLPNPYPVMPDSKQDIPSPANPPLFFNVHQYSLVAALAALIVPTDDEPGATEAGVAGYIDRLVNESEKKQKAYTRGLVWIDNISKDEFSKDFLSLTVKEQIDLLISIDEIVSKVNRKVNRLPERISRKIDELWNNMFGLGIISEFFDTIRTDVMHGYYSSPVSWKAIGYFGPPQPSGYPDYSKPPSPTNFTGTIRPLSNDICQNCHFDEIDKENHQDLFDCMDCHDPHFPMQRDKSK